MHGGARIKSAYYIKEKEMIYRESLMKKEYVIDELYEELYNRAI